MHTYIVHTSWHLVLPAYVVMYAYMHGVLCCLMNISRTRHRCRGAAAEETAAAAEAEAAGTMELHMGQMPKPNQAVQQ